MNEDYKTYRKRSLNPKTPKVNHNSTANLLKDPKDLSKTPYQIKI